MLLGRVRGEPVGCMLRSMLVGLELGSERTKFVLQSFFPRFKMCFLSARELFRSPPQEEGVHLEGLEVRFATDESFRSAF